jgi:8-oxo-dGTP pyrophosphatase MutT (NUDIX family)
MTKEKSCGALVYYKNGDRLQILILKHRLGGQWSFPKGHMENDETEVETALREVNEETGLTITLLDGFREMVSYFPKPGVSKDVVYFLGFTDDSTTVMKEDEIGDIRWVDLNHCHRYLTYANDKQLLSHAKACLRKRGIYNGFRRKRRGNTQKK